MLLAEAWPTNVHVVRYADLRVDTPTILNEILDFFGIRLKQEDSLEWSINQCSKEKTSRQEAPQSTTKVVRADKKDPLAIYSLEDKAYFLDIFRRHLKSQIPYDLETW